MSFTFWKRNCAVNTVRLLIRKYAYPPRGVPQDPTDVKQRGLIVRHAIDTGRITNLCARMFRPSPLGPLNRLPRLYPSNLSVPKKNQFAFAAVTVIVISEIFFDLRLRY